ncbi:MAG: ParB/RepB/Spo0J family partition protein [bacterium]
MLNFISSFLNKKKYKRFDDEFGQKKIKNRSYQGTKPIDLSKIAGTVSRTPNQSNKLIDTNSCRYKKIENALYRLEHVPPIKVYEVDEEYYILDGHHRYEASKAIGKDFLDAEVIKYEFH